LRSGSSVASLLAKDAVSSVLLLQSLLLGQPNFSLATHTASYMAVKIFAGLVAWIGTG
jgi:hypothetical protein